MNYAGFGSLCRPNDLDNSWCWPNPFHTETTRGHDFYRGREPLDILGWAIYMILKFYMYVILHMRGGSCIDGNCTGSATWSNTQTGFPNRPHSLCQCPLGPRLTEQTTRQCRPKRRCGFYQHYFCWQWLACSCQSSHPFPVPWLQSVAKFLDSDTANKIWTMSDIK